MTRKADTAANVSVSTKCSATNKYSIHTVNNMHLLCLHLKKFIAYFATIYNHIVHSCYTKQKHVAKRICMQHIFMEIEYRLAAASFQFSAPVK